VFQHFGIELLAAEARSFVSVYNILDKVFRKVISILEGGATYNAHVLTLEHLLDNRDRARGCGNDAFWLKCLAVFLDLETMPELKLIPRIVIAPRCKLISPERIALKTTEPAGLV